jgi:hypothetical protein
MSPIPSLESMEFFDQIFPLGFLLPRLEQDDRGRKMGVLEPEAYHEGPSRSLEGLEQGTPATASQEGGSGRRWRGREKGTGRRGDKDQDGVGESFWRYTDAASAQSWNLGKFRVRTTVACRTMDGGEAAECGRCSKTGEVLMSPICLFLS